MSLSCSAWSSPLRDTRHDLDIRQAAVRWWPGLPWRLWKAQLIAESGLDPTARSPVGAEGIAQFMGPTWAEVSKDLGYVDVPRSSARHAINAGAYYMAKIKRPWRMPEFERHKFTAAAYNAGGGNIRRAWRLCGEPQDWSTASKCLEDITGRHHTETLNYVARIFRLWQELEKRG